jgi:hypothetical protein
MLPPGPSLFELENVSGAAAPALPSEGFEIYPEPVRVKPENAGGHELQPTDWWRIFQDPSVIDPLLFDSRANHEPEKIAHLLVWSFRWRWGSQHDPVLLQASTDPCRRSTTHVNRKNRFEVFEVTPLDCAVVVKVTPQSMAWQIFNFL